MYICTVWPICPIIINVCEGVSSISKFLRLSTSIDWSVQRWYWVIQWKSWLTSQQFQEVDVGPLVSVAQSTPGHQAVTRLLRANTQSQCEGCHHCLSPLATCRNIYIVSYFDLRVTPGQSDMWAGKWESDLLSADKQRAQEGLPTTKQGKLWPLCQRSGVRLLTSARWDKETWPWPWLSSWRVRRYQL